MTTVVLLRHGQSTANVAGVLAGRTEGVELEEKGRAQAAAVAGRLAGVRFDLLVSSPLLRCRQTIAPLAEATGLAVSYDERFSEIDYGSWSNRPLKDLAGEDLWKIVQGRPSAAVFPDGEGLAEASHRAAAGIREVIAAAGPAGVALICSHGDVIKAILADALGLHLDGFQRIVVAPASVSVIRYTSLRPFVERVNDSGDIGTLRPPPEPASAESAEESTSGKAVAPPIDESDGVPGGETA